MLTILSDNYVGTGSLSATRKLIEHLAKENHPEQINWLFYGGININQSLLDNLPENVQLHIFKSLEDINHNLIENMDQSDAIICFPEIHGISIDDIQNKLSAKAPKIVTCYQYDDRHYITEPSCINNPSICCSGLQEGHLGILIEDQQNNASTTPIADYLEHNPNADNQTNVLSCLFGQDISQLSVEEIRKLESKHFSTHDLNFAYFSKSDGRSGGLFGCEDFVLLNILQAMQHPTGKPVDIFVNMELEHSLKLKWGRDSDKPILPLHGTLKALKSAGLMDKLEIEFYSDPKYQQIGSDMFLYPRFREKMQTELQNLCEEHPNVSLFPLDKSKAHTMPETDKIKVRIISGFPVDKPIFDALSRNASGPIGATGDQSFTEALGKGKVFIYELLWHKIYLINGLYKILNEQDDLQHLKKWFELQIDERVLKYAFQQGSNPSVRYAVGDYPFNQIETILSYYNENKEALESEAQQLAQFLREHHNLYTQFSNLIKSQRQLHKQRVENVTSVSDNNQRNLIQFSDSNKKVPVATLKQELQNVETIQPAIIHIATRDELDILDLLKDTHVDIFNVNTGLTALMELAENGQFKAMQRLVAVGANLQKISPISNKSAMDYAQATVNKYDGETGLTPLMSAAQENNKELYDFLIEIGANPNLKNHEEKTAEQMFKPQNEIAVKK